MRRTLIALIVLAGAPACSQPEEATVAPAPADTVKAEVKVRAPPSLDEAARVTPATFIRALYARYSSPRPGGDVVPPPGQDPIYSARLNRLIAADFERAAGEVPSLNYDPVCDCQDGGAFRLEGWVLRPTRDDAVDARVTFTNAGEEKTLTLSLVKEGERWRVDDVLPPGRPPLSEHLAAPVS